MGASEEILANARKAIAPEPELEVFEDNLLPARVFQRMGTQWTVDSGAQIGLRYEALPIVMRYSKVKPEEEEQVFEDVQAMEDEAIRVFTEKRA